MLRNAKSVFTEEIPAAAARSTFYFSLRKKMVTPIVELGADWLWRMATKLEGIFFTRKQVQQNGKMRRKNEHIFKREMYSNAIK